MHLLFIACHARNSEVSVRPCTSESRRARSVRQQPQETVDPFHGLLLRVFFRQLALMIFVFPQSQRHFQFAPPLGPPSARSRSSTSSLPNRCPTRSIVRSCRHPHDLVGKRLGFGFKSSRLDVVSFWLPQSHAHFHSGDNFSVPARSRTTSFPNRRPVRSMNAGIARSLRDHPTSHNGASRKPWLHPPFAPMSSTQAVADPASSSTRTPSRTARKIRRPRDTSASGAIRTRRGMRERPDWEAEALQE